MINDTNHLINQANPDSIEAISVPLSADIQIDRSINGRNSILLKKLSEVQSVFSDQFKEHLMLLNDCLDGFDSQCVLDAAELVADTTINSGTRMAVFSLLAISPTPEARAYIEDKLGGDFQSDYPLHGSSITDKTGRKYQLRAQMCSYNDLRITAELDEYCKEPIIKGRWGLHDIETPSGLKPEAKAFVEITISPYLHLRSTTVESEFSQNCKDEYILTTTAVDCKFREVGLYSSLITALCTYFPQMHKIRIQDIIETDTRLLIEGGIPFLSTVLGSPFSKMGFRRERLEGLNCPMNLALMTTGNPSAVLYRE